jgi:hypothetical protein
VRVSVTGGPEVEAALRELGNRVTAVNTARRALKQAADPIQQRAQSLAPDDPATGAGKYLKESIKVAPRKSRDKDQVWVSVGIDKSVDPPKQVVRKRRKGTYRDPGVAGVSVIMEFGAPAKNIAPRPFMGPAWEAEKMATPQRIVDVLAVEVSKSAARASRKAARGVGK